MFWKNQNELYFQDDKGNTSKLIADTVALFITAMDKLRLDIRGVMNDLYAITGDCVIKFIVGCYLLLVWGGGIAQRKPSRFSPCTTGFDSWSLKSIRSA